MMVSKLRDPFRRVFSTLPTPFEDVGASTETVLLAAFLNVKRIDMMVLLLWELVVRDLIRPPHRGQGLLL